MTSTWLTTWRLTLAFRSAGLFDKAPESLVRATLGAALLEAVCPYRAPTGDPPCGRCPMQLSCAWPVLFKPGVLHDGPTTPPPYSLAWYGPDALTAGSRAYLDVTLVGAAQAHLPLTLDGLKQLWLQGIGRRDARARADVVDVVELPPPAPPVGLADSITLALDTPLTLREWRDDRRVELSAFDAAAFARACRRRLESLGAPIDVPADDDLIAEAIRTRPTTRRAYSARQDRPLYARGLVGQVDLGGPIGPWMPALAALTRLGVGRMTTWGNGRISLWPRGEAPAPPGRSPHRRPERRR